MSAIIKIFVGKVTKIEDEASWAVRITFIGSENLGEDGPTALPWGSITSQIEVDDSLIIFQVDDKPGSYFYMPIKLTKGRIGIFNKETFLNITDPDNLIFQCQDKSFLSFKGKTYINVADTIEVRGPGKMKVNGLAIPNGQGAFLGIKKCLYAGVDMCSDELTLLDAPEEAPDTDKESESE